MADERHEFQLAQDKFLRLLRELELSEIDSLYVAGQHWHIETNHRQSSRTTQTRCSPPGEVVWTQLTLDQPA